ncbi:MAG: sodium:proton antiporter [Acidobacteria bacterium]|nr:sodium:proton antiporter [Acidobacteriota bacterium]
MDSRHSFSPSYRWQTLVSTKTATLLVCAVAALVALVFVVPPPPGDIEPAIAHVARGLPLWAGLPFAGMLLSIALFPLLLPQFWHHHYQKVSVAWALVFFAPFYLQYGTLAVFRLLEVLLVDYVPFLMLLWGLYTVSGGILLRAQLVATPTLNAVFLLGGLVIASLMGTTGASMLLIRPMLRANAWRRHKAHVFVFFIFLVSNIGGLLTPLGDPPLFLGFIHGVPFFWTLRLFPEYLFVSALVLGAFVAIDSVLIRRELDARPTHDRPHTRTSFRIEGWHNFLLLFGILGAVLLSGFWKTPAFQWFGIHLEYRNLVRDLLIVIIGLVSIAATPRKVRDDNGFTWGAIQEVAVLFFGIFVTIIPVLMILRAGNEGAMGFLVTGITHPWQYFWMSGALSSFLDNAPTYLTFMALALGQLGIPSEQVTAVLSGAVTGPQAAQFASYLSAVSLGSVMMGANTYIGNAPNFMVLSIAKEHGVRMPSFFGYMLWSGVVLLPAFALVTLVFF